MAAGRIWDSQTNLSRRGNGRSFPGRMVDQVLLLCYIIVYLLVSMSYNTTELSSNGVPDPGENCGLLLLLAPD